MSVFQTSDSFAGAGIQELNYEEIDNVAGGPLPIVAAYYAIGIVGTLYVGAQAGLSAMRLGYAANNRRPINAE